MDDSAGRDALQHIATACADRPKRNAHALSSALRCLSAYRRELITRHRHAANAGSREALDHVNAVISCVMAVQFPVGQVPWDELSKGRQWLADVIARVTASPAPEA